MKLKFLLYAFWVPLCLSFFVTTASGNPSQVYVDRGVTAANQLQALAGAALAEHPADRAFHLFSHGRPGELLIEGQWKDAPAIADWIKASGQWQPGQPVDVYGCAFAKGIAGHQALSYLEKNLGVMISASDNVTGKNGDWRLEKGHNKGLNIKNYAFDLQSVVYKQSFESGAGGIVGFYANYYPDPGYSSVGFQGIGPPMYTSSIGPVEGSKFWFTTTPNYGSQAGDVFYTSGISVQANRNYQLRYYHRNIGPYNSAYLQLKANGVVVSGDYASNYGWTLVSITWNSGSATSLTLQITNLTNTSDGNDFMLDDIEVVDPCGTVSTPTVSSVTHPTCASSTGSISLSGLPSGSWTLQRTPGGNIPGSGTTTTVTGLTSGSYTFMVTTAAGCSSATTAGIAVNVQPASPSAPTIGTVTQPNCSSATGSIVLNGLPASGTWTVTRNPGAVTTTGSGTTTTISGLAANDYTFTVTNAAGCISPTSTAQTINAQPATPATPVASNPAAICSGDAIPTLTAIVPGGITVDWFNTATGGTPLATGTATYTPSAAGTYFAEARNTVGGCVSAGRAAVTVTSNPSPNAGSTGILPICSGAPVSTAALFAALGGTPQAGGTWSPSVVSNTSSAIYTYTVTSVATCPSAAATVALIVNALPNAGIDKSVACFNKDTVTLEASGTGSWSIAAGSAGTANIFSATNPASKVSGFSAAGVYKLVWTNGSCTDTTLITAGTSCAPAKPDFTPEVIIDESEFMEEGDTHDFVVKIKELNGVNSTGQVVITMQKQSGFIFNFTSNATSSSVGGGTAVSNNDWTFTQTATNYVLTLKPGVQILANQFSRLGFSITRAEDVPANTTRVIRPTITNGTGGDNLNANNITSKNIIAR